jgi:hypothetical protein
LARIAAIGIQFYQKGEKPKKYRGTFEVIDEHTQQVMATCNLIGQAVFATFSIDGHNQQAWRMDHRHG